MDLSFLHGTSMTDIKNEIPFQSLFLWIFRSYWSVVFNFGGLDNPVSILVLMDLSFLQKILDEITERLVEFQSLFLWIFRSYATTTELLSVEIPVSILVLMDLSFLQNTLAVT